MRKSDNASLIALPSANEAMRQVALAAAEKAAEAIRRQEKVDAETTALIGRLIKPSGVSDGPRARPQQ